MRLDGNIKLSDFLQVASGSQDCVSRRRCLSLGKDLFDRIEIGAVGRQEDQVGASCNVSLPRRLLILRSQPDAPSMRVLVFARLTPGPVTSWPQGLRKSCISTGSPHSGVEPSVHHRLLGQGKASTMSLEVIPFARSAQGERDDNSQLDKAGQTILQLLNKAADVAEQNSRLAIDTAQKLAHQLRAAEDRISELESEVAAYREQAERAEQWLHRVYTEIEDRFLRQPADHRGTPQRSRVANGR